MENEKKVKFQSIFLHWRRVPAVPTGNTVVSIQNANRNQNVRPRGVSRDCADEINLRTSTRSEMQRERQPKKISTGKNGGGWKRNQRRNRKEEGPTNAVPASDNAVVHQQQQQEHWTLAGYSMRRDIPWWTPRGRFPVYPHPSPSFFFFASKQSAAIPRQIQ